MKINPKDIVINLIAHDGRVGGWNFEQNKGVMLVHLPTGKVFTSTLNQSQHKNKDVCMKQLEDYLDNTSFRRELIELCLRWKCRGDAYTNPFLVQGVCDALQETDVDYKDEVVINELYKWASDLYEM